MPLRRALFSRYTLAAIALATVAFVVLVVLGLVREGFESYGDDLQAYVNAVVEDRYDEAASRMCDELLEEIDELPGGFAEARRRTLDRISGEIEEVQFLRGTSDYGALRVYVEGGESRTLFVEHRANDSDARFCPHSAEYLLGTPNRPG